MKRRPLQFALGLALLLAVPARLCAVDDAGTRSVFAFGAGNRALGLGGAYTGIANDASAPLWNAGGLGWVQRRMFDASYTRLYGLGIDEGYAALVLPSWRYGTLGLTFQQFSIGGIDVRDDRNFVTGTDESDSQTQIGLGYGRALGPAWSFGGAVKVQRHSLAGYSGAGVGVDLGLAVRPGLAFHSGSAWAERWSVGVAVQNAVQPTIRLDQSSVSDPVTARVGCGYWFPIQGRHAVLLSGDVEKTSDMHPRGHLGFEAMLGGVLALRAGYDADRMTAGTGVQLRDLSIDYVYEDNPIDAVHRIGASFRFGRSVADSRLAAQQAEEAALEARLAEEFRKRQAEQVTVLLRDADAARQNQHFDAALETIGTIQLLDAENTAARQLEAACLRGKARKLEAAGETTDAALTWSRLLALQPGDAAATAGQARCRSLSDQRAVRSNEMRQTFAAAVEAFGAEDFVKARQGFARALEISPKDAEARDMLQRTQKAIAHRATSLVQLADRLCREGVVEEAWDLADQARRLDPKTAGLDELTARLRAARAAHRAHAPAAGSPAGSGQAPAPAAVHADLSRAATQEVEDLYRRGVEAMQSGRTQDAVRYWELVWGMDPDYQRVREHLKREYMTQGLERFAQGELAEAITQWEKALQVDPTDARAVAYLARAQEQQARTREILGDGHRGSP